MCLKDRLVWKKGIDTNNGMGGMNGRYRKGDERDGYKGWTGWDERDVNKGWNGWDERDIYKGWNG